MMNLELKSLFNLDTPTLLLTGLVVYILVLLIIALGLVILTIYLHNNNEKKAQKWKKLESSWEPLMGQIITNTISVQEVHQQIQPEEGLFFVDFLTRYSLRLSGASRQLIEQLAAPWLPKLADRVTTGDEEQRARAIFTLSALGSKPFQVVIASALDDEVPLVSMLAAQSLAENHAIDYLPDLLRHMDHFKAWSPTYLTSMLVKISETNPQKLRQSITHGDYPIWIQTVAIRALSELNDIDSIPYALSLLESNADPELQSASLDLLGKLGFEEHKSLVRNKAQDPRFVIRLHAVKALTHLGDQQDLKLFQKLLDDPSQWIAYQAAQGLKAIGANEILEQLADSNHARANLAQQVLFDLDEKLLLTSAQSASFAERVPAWIRNTIRNPSSDAWHRVQGILFHPHTHPDVKQAISQSLTPEASSVMFPIIKRQLSTQQDSDPGYLYCALYQLNPLGSLDTLRQHFFSIQHVDARLEIMDYLLKHHTPTTQQFVHDLRIRLDNGLESSPEMVEKIESKLKGFSALPT